MGMFDSLYDADGGEWQTKAFDRVLARYRIGDLVGESAVSYQVEVLGCAEGTGESYALVTAGRLAAVPVCRDETLPLVGYSGGLVSMGQRS